MILKRALPVVAGSVTASAILAAEHVFLNRAGLRRVDAYVAGTAGLDAGYGVTQWFAGRSPELWELALIQAVGGSTVKGLYWLDRKLLKPLKPGDVVGQLKETLNENEELRAEVWRLKNQLQEEQNRPGIKAYQLEEWVLNLFGSVEELNHVLVVLESVKTRIRERLPEVRKIETTEHNRIHNIYGARASRKQKTGTRPVSET